MRAWRPPLHDGVVATGTTQIDPSGAPMEPSPASGSYSRFGVVPMSAQSAICGVGVTVVAVKIPTPGGADKSLDEFVSFRCLRLGAVAAVEGR